jgi:hypothetical protein
MKKLVISGVISLLALSITPAPLQARSNPNSIPSTTPVENPQAKALLLRLDEIKAMDKTQLTATEKKDLRKEVKAIKKDLKTMNQGVYLSVGAIVIIVLLLILLL